MLAYVLLFLKGTAIGAANIVPGISGATIAVILRIYDRLISSVNNLFSDTKKSLKLLIPVGIGMAAGIVALAEAINFLLANYNFQTLAAIAGLMAGSLPFIHREAIGKGTKRIHLYFITLVFVSALILFGFVATPATVGTDEVRLSFGFMAYLFVGGGIAAATMIVPGVSGAIVLTLLGLYPLVINTIAQIRAYLTDPSNFALLPPIFMVVIPLGIGIIFGIIACSRLIGVLLNRFLRGVYAAILGLVIGTIIIIFMGLDFGGLSTGLIVYSTISFLCGTIVSLVLGKRRP